MIVELFCTEYGPPKFVKSSGDTLFLGPGPSLFRDRPGGYKADFFTIRMVTDITF